MIYLVIPTLNTTSPLHCTLLAFVGAFTAVSVSRYLLTSVGGEKITCMMKIKELNTRESEGSYVKDEHVL